MLGCTGCFHPRWKQPRILERTTEVDRVMRAQHAFGIIARRRDDGEPILIFGGKISRLLREIEAHSLRVSWLILAGFSLVVKHPAALNHGSAPKYAFLR